jgi:hypothetical protein
MLREREILKPFECACKFRPASLGLDVDTFQEVEKLNSKTILCIVVSCRLKLTLQEIKIQRLEQLIFPRLIISCLFIIILKFRWLTYHKVFVLSFFSLLS